MGSRTQGGSGVRGLEHGTVHREGETAQYHIDQTGDDHDGRADLQHAVGHLVESVKDVSQRAPQGAPSKQGGPFEEQTDQGEERADTDYEGKDQEYGAAQDLGSCTDAEPFSRRYGVSERKDEPVEIPGFGQEHQAEEHHGDYPQHPHPLAPVLPPAHTSEQGCGHRRRRTPDVSRDRTPDREHRHLVVASVAAPEHLAERLVGGQRRQGDREDLLHLVGGQYQLGLRRQEPDKRADAEVRGRDVHLLQLPYYLHQFGSEVDLLLGLAQCRLHQRAVTRLHTAPGKGDLAGVVGEIVLPHRIDHPRILILHEDRYQHSGASRVRTRRRHPRSPFSSLEIYGRKALVNLTPLLERAGDRLPQPVREITPAVRFVPFTTFIHSRDHSV